MQSRAPSRRAQVFDLEGLQTPREMLTPSEMQDLVERRTSDVAEFFKRDPRRASALAKSLGNNPFGSSMRRLGDVLGSTRNVFGGGSPKNADGDGTPEQATPEKFRPPLKRAGTCG